MADPLIIVPTPVTVFQNPRKVKGPYWNSTLVIVPTPVKNLGNNGVSKTMLSGTVKTALGLPLRRMVKIYRGAGFEELLTSFRSNADGAFSYLTDGGKNDLFNVVVIGEPTEDSPLVSRVAGEVTIITPLWGTHYPVTFDDTTCFATTRYDSPDSFHPSNAVNPALLMTNMWFSLLPPDTVNQKFAIDYGAGNAFVATRMLLENYTTNGLDRGMNHFSIYGSNSVDAVTNITDYADEANLTLLANGLQAVMASGATSNPQYFEFPNTTEYRYYLLKIVDNYGGALLGFSHVAFQENIA